MERIHHPRPVFVAAHGMIPVGRYDGKDRESLTFLEIAARMGELFDRFPVRRRQIDTVIVGSQNPGAFSRVDNTAAKISGVLGISGVKSILVDTASSSGASAFEAAYLEVASGRSDTVLAIGIQKMSDASTLRATDIVAGVIDTDEAEYGLSMPACGALVARALMERLDLDFAHWSAFSALLSERAHRFSSRNPDAHLREELPLSRYFQEIVTGRNYLYWWPLRYHDFCPMSDGAAAVILSARPSPIVVSGVGSATDIPTIADRRYFHSFPATVRAAAQAYGMAGIKSLSGFERRIHVNMHDPFNGFGPINLVDLGIVHRHRLLDALLDDRLTGEDGLFPTNLTGGLKGRGHPLGATGMIQIVENCRLMEERGYDLAISHSIGGPINNNVVILLERAESRIRRNPTPYRPWGLPVLGGMKPPGLTIETLLEKGPCRGRFVTSTTKFHHKSGEPLQSIIIVSCRENGERYPFLFGVPGGYFDSISRLSPGDELLIERGDDGIRINRIPVQRFYRRTMAGLRELFSRAGREEQR
ncbi:MAG: thiolase family protein [Desulfuromonadia bacterium]